MGASALGSGEENYRTEMQIGEAHCMDMIMGTPPRMETPMGIQIPLHACADVEKCPHEKPLVEKKKQKNPWPPGCQTPKQKVFHVQYRV